MKPAATTYPLKTAVGRPPTRKPLLKTWYRATFVNQSPTHRTNKMQNEYTIMLDCSMCI